MEMVHQKINPMKLSFSLAIIFIIAGITSCDLQKKEEQNHKISFPIRLVGDDSDFVLTYFNYCNPAEFFSDEFKQEQDGKKRYSMSLSCIQELTVQELLLFSSLSDRNDTLIIIDWPINWPKSVQSLYKWEGDLMTLPIVRFVPETGEVYRSKLYMGRENKINGWWILMEPRK